MEPARTRGMLERLAPWSLGFAVFLACFFSPQESPILSAKPGAGKYYLDIQGFSDADTHPWVFVTIVTLSALAAVLARRKSWPIYVMAVIAWMTFSLWPVPFVATYGTVLRFRRRRQLIWYLIIAFALIALPFVLGDNFSELPDRERIYAFGLFISLTIVTPALFALWVRARNQRILALIDRNARLRGEQEAQHRQARAEERNRIARDMHDVVANRIALMVMHAGALQLGTQKQDDVMKEATLITALGRTALTELRDVLGVLRKSKGEESEVVAEEPLAFRLEKLAEEARAAGVPLDYRVEGKTLEVPPDAARFARERAIYRVAQEALTNVMKHAHGAQTVMTLRRSAHSVEVMVDNAPPARRRRPEMPLPGAGLGQIGMRERITVLNGQFESGPRPDGGYMVHAVLPY